MDLRELGQLEQDLVFGDAGTKEVINFLRSKQVLLSLYVFPTGVPIALLLGFSFDIITIFLPYRTECTRTNCGF